MTTVTIPQMNPTTQVNDADLMEISQSNVTFKLSFQQLKAYTSNNTLLTGTPQATSLDIVTPNAPAATFRFQQRPSITSQAAGVIYPTNANGVCAMDIMPNGSPVANEYAWLDVCQQDVLNSTTTPLNFLHMAARKYNLELGSRVLYGGTGVPLSLNYLGVDTAWVNANGFGVGGLSSSCIFQVSNNAVTLLNGYVTPTGLPTWTITGTPMAQIAAADGVPTRVAIDSFGSAPFIDFRRADNTAASPGAVVLGDVMGQLEFSGHNGSVYAYNKASVLIQAAENWNTGANGTEFGVYLTPRGSTSLGKKIGVTNGGTLFVGTGLGALATTATEGFMGLPATNGAPTGVPSITIGGAAIVGIAPMVYDTVNHKLWVYDGGWKGVVLS